MARFLERLLNLQHGDLARGSLLFFHLFLVMASYLVARVVRDALFLGKYNPDKLPFADLAIAALVGFAVSGYLLIGRRLHLRTLLAGSQLFFALNCFLFWYLSRFELAWLYPVIYVWVGLFGVLCPAQVWTLANYVLTTREAKRVFGLVGSGAIAGAILGGKFASLMAPRFGTPSLLLAIALALAACSGLVFLIWRQKEAIRAHDDADDEHREREEEEKALPLRHSLKLVWADPNLRAIASLILISSVVTTVAGWQFKALSRNFFPNRDHLAAFFGAFYFYAGLAGLFVQVLITPRLLRRFGLGPALFVVPVALTFGSLGVMFWGTVTIWAAIALRSCINVLQYSIDKPSVELLYLPVAANIKNAVKSFIDTVIWRFGDGLGALALLLFVTTLKWSAPRVSWINLAFILAWFVAAVVARRRYVVNLSDSIQKHRLDAERASAPVLDRSTLDILAANIVPTDPDKILYALSLFELEGRQAAHPAIRELLLHPAPQVRQKALSILSAARDKSVLPTVEKMLHDPHLGVRTEALLYLAHHAHIDPLACIQQLGDFPDFSIRSSVVAFLARPGDTQNLVAARIMLDEMVKETGSDGARTRLEAARLLSFLPDVFDDQLRLLLSDTDKEVVRAAIAAVGALRKRRFLFRLIDFLGEPDYSSHAADALVSFGDRIVGTLRDHLGDPSIPIEIRREIPAILARIHSPVCVRVLVDSLLESDSTLRFRIISALNKLRRDHPEFPLDAQMVETVLAAEIMGHYRSYQILGTLGMPLESDEPVAKALRESMRQEIERIFRLLGLLFPQHDLHSAYFGLQSSDPVVHGNAIEFLDNVLKPQLRQLLVPLIDGDVSLDTRVHLANRIVGAQVESREQAVAALLLSDDPWLKSCGAYAVGSLGLRSLEHALDDCLRHEDPLLRETARQAKLRLASA
jgi:AAA family ATP:ADP antiporter